MWVDRAMLVCLCCAACPSSVTISSDNNVCGASYSYNVSSGDNCGAPSVTRLSGLASGAVFPVGSSPNFVQYSVTDSSGNSVDCSFNVTVTDVQSPSIGRVLCACVCGLVWFCCSSFFLFFFLFFVFCVFCSVFCVFCIREG